MKSLKCVLHTVSWLLVCVAALHLGLAALDYNLLGALLGYLPAGSGKVLGYLFGLAGLFSLYHLGVHVTNHGKAGHGSCDCK